MPVRRTDRTCVHGMLRAMTLVAPDPAHVDCRLTASGLGRLSDVFDDIEWWRRTVRVGDTLEAIVDRIPDDTLAEPERKALA